jgi:hypothetical protein
MLLFSVPYEQVVDSIRRTERRRWVRDFLIEVMPLIGSHFAGMEPESPPRRVTRRFYPLARDIMIPFEAPLEYSIGGQVYFPWFSFWRSNPLADKPLSLFVAIVEEVLLQDPDLDTADFHILDFSRLDGEEKRRLRITSAHEIPRLEEREKRAMLEVSADGYRLARNELASSKPADEARRPDPIGGTCSTPTWTNKNRVEGSIRPR